MELDPHNIPFDCETSDTRLLRENIALHALNDGLGRRLSIELFRIIFVVYIVSHSHELATIVGAGQKNHRDTKDVGFGDASCVGRVGFEQKLVHTDRNGPDKQGIELLVVLVTKKGVRIMFGAAFGSQNPNSRCSRANIGQLPLQVYEVAVSKE